MLLGGRVRVEPPIVAITIPSNIMLEPFTSAANGHCLLVPLVTSLLRLLDGAC